MDKLSIPGSSPGATSASGSAKALVKGLALVDVVWAADEPVRLADLVAASGLPRPTVLRLLDVLLEERVLQPVADGSFALGPRLALWGQRYLDGLDVRAHAEDLMRALAERTRETCFLGIRDDRSVLYVAKADSPQAVRPAARIGTRNPLHSTGIGKALLAFAPPDAGAPTPGRDARGQDAEHDRRPRPARRRAGASPASAGTRSTTSRTRTACAAWRRRSAITAAR